MNITVAVGLITAASTLAGGLVASITSLKIQGKQLRDQNTQLKAERHERQDAERRSIRREAYIQLLNQLDKVDQLICVWWPDADSIRKEMNKYEGDISDVSNALDVLENLMNIVSLEGPKAAELAAKKAADTFADSNWALEDELRKTKEGTATLDEDKYDKCNTERNAAKEAFIEEARKVLE